MKNTSNERIEQLLPWYATGKLQNGERIEVEKALARAPELRKQLALIRDELAQTVALNEAVAPPAGATDRFMDLLHKQVRPREPIKGFLEWLALQVMGAPRWAIAAGVLAMIIQAPIIGALVVERQVNLYHTAGGPGELASGTLVLARFADGAALSTVIGQLAALNVTIVDGPKAGWFFTLRIGPKDMPAAERDKMTAALRSHADTIVFVGPVQ